MRFHLAIPGSLFLDRIFRFDSGEVLLRFLGNPWSSDPADIFLDFLVFCSLAPHCNGFHHWCLPQQQFTMAVWPSVEKVYFADTNECILGLRRLGVLHGLDLINSSVLMASLRLRIAYVGEISFKVSFQFCIPFPRVFWSFSRLKLVF